MRKNFFKQLSFGMALALVLGTTAHAGVAQAAETTWALKTNSKILYLNEDNVQGTPDNYDFNFKNKPAGWKNDYAFEWRSADESIATVAKGGVVQAKSVGKTTITCYITEKEGGKFVEAVSAKVTVKANADDVEILNKAEYDAEDGISVNTGAVIDLNRAMYDADGNKTTKRGVYVTDYTRWYALDKDANLVGEDVVSIDQKTGKFTMKKAGIYGLVCETYQSAANPQAIVNDFVMVNVVDVEEKMTLNQIDVTSFEMTLSENVAYSKDAYTAKAEETFIQDYIDIIVNLDGDIKDEVAVKSIQPKKDKDGNVITYENGKIKTFVVTLWDNFVDDAEYTVGLKLKKDATVEEYVLKESFVASVGKPEYLKVDIKNPLTTADEQYADKLFVSCEKSPEQKFTVQFFDDNDKDVTKLYLDGTMMLQGKLEAEVIGATDEDEYYVHADADALTITAYEGVENKKFTLKVSYFEYDEEKNAYVEKAQAVGSDEFRVVTAPAVSKIVPSTVKLALFKQNDVPNKGQKFEGMKTKVAANDAVLYVAAYGKNIWGDEISNTDTEWGEFRFYINKDQVAEVDDITGLFTPYEKGRARVNLYFISADDEERKEEYVKSLDITVGDPREVQKLTVVDKSTISLTSNVVLAGGFTDIKDTATFYLKAWDNYGEEVTTLGADDFSYRDLNADDAEEESIYFEYGGYVKDHGYKFTVTNTDSDVIEYLTNDDNVEKASVTIFAHIGLAEIDKTEKKLSVTLKKPADKIITDYVVELVEVTENADNSERETVVGTVNAASHDTTDGIAIIVYGLNKQKMKVELIEGTEYTFLDTTIGKYVEGLNKDENPIAYTTDLVYTITKGTKVVKADGAGVPASVATGAAIVTSAIKGETMQLTEAEDADVITLIKAIANEATDDNTITYTNADGSYVITLYKIETNSKGDYKYDKQDTATLRVENTPVALSVAPTAITTDVTGFAQELENKLQWTYDEDVREVVETCFDIKLNGSDKIKIDGVETKVKDLPMSYNVRINNNRIYIKNIRVFVPVADGEYTTVTYNVNWTITILD